MTRYESLLAHKQLLVQRIKQNKNYMSAHQLRVLRNRVKRYNSVIKLFSKSNEQLPIAIGTTNNQQLLFA